MKFDPVGAENFIRVMRPEHFVDEPAQSIDPHDPHVRCWSGQ
jgi:hypothetical protein